jgi:hypothetical protein
MSSPRILRTIETVLDQAEAAVARQDWDGVVAAAWRVIAIDPASEDAMALLRLARADVDPAAAARIDALLAPAASVPLLAAIEDEVRVPAMAGVAGVGALSGTSGVFGADPEPPVPPVHGLDAALASFGRAPAAISFPRTPRLAGHRPRRRRFIVDRMRRPRRRGVFLWRGPLVLTACVAATTVALVSMGGARWEDVPSFAARSAESAPQGDTLHAPLAETATPVPTPVATLTPVPAPPVPPPSQTPAPSIIAAVPVATPPPPVPATRRYAGTFGGSLGRVTALNRCEWEATYAADMEAAVTRALDGSLTGTATSRVRVTYSVTHTPPDAICHTSEVAAEASGPVSGDGTQVTASLAGLNELAIAFRGAPSGDALVGDATLQRRLSTNSAFGTTATTAVAPPVAVVLQGS